MNRRNLIKKMGVVALYSSFPSVLSGFLVSCKAKDKNLRAGFFTNEEFELLNRLIDVILPRTSTPGGLDVNTPYFIELVVRDCMNGDDQQLIKKGLEDLNKDNEKIFSSLSEVEQRKVV
ncbi:MAG TPA: gluconate 2-dehydrogenase subunit 3 family protein, partial [Chitinophagaceae bacterium]|nr:gluconate 2-dehydrogenase subunit 3 family protein [Chitinophagaceae bacterium]